MQFFILYKSAHHLDYKHTVFGRVVGGKPLPWLPVSSTNSMCMLAFKRCGFPVTCPHPAAPKLMVPCASAGFEVLTAMEKVPTDDDDRPKQEIKITGATVFVNPYKEEEEAEQKAAEEARLKVLPP